MACWLDRLALGALLILPAFLLHGRGIADVLLSVVGIAFLASSTIRGDWSWTRRPWVRIGLAWWVWLVACSLPGVGAGTWLTCGRAAAAIRFLLLVAALEHRVLRPPEARRWLARVLAAATLYIGLSAWLQVATGRDLVGWRRSVDGELTGPFQHARAGAPLSRLLFPTVLPVVARLLADNLFRKIIGMSVAVLSAGTVVLIGQRMPVLLTALGLIVSGVLLRRLRGAVMASLAAGALLIAASAIVSPPTFHRLVEKFSAQMGSFGDSPYGLLAVRAVAIVSQHPLFGQGYEGFRTACPDPRTWVGSPYAPAHGADGGGLGACNLHPHNYYLEAATDAGLPGLVLFCALMVAWLRDLARDLGRDPDPLRIGLIVAALVHAWPLASTTSFYAVELSGFAFVMIGWGLAEARAGTSSTSPMLPSAARPTM